MSKNTARLAALSASVFARIENRFTPNDGGALEMTSPLNEGVFFALYNDNGDGTWDVMINDKHNPSKPDLNRLGSEADAKKKVAQLIAEEILAAEELLASAEFEGLLDA
eukprot:GHVR01176934.1.p3 GENE.GHVR01176934.1~~GHVR01176934.1.p3  ORF type:complete len:109 (-),score=27.12 GHVR01176934.1:1121-1447(-)